MRSLRQPLLISALFRAVSEAFGHPVPLLATLYRITINVTTDSLRRQSRRSEVELDDAIPSFLPGPGFNFERAEIREQVYAALAQLTQNIALLSF